MPGFVQFVLFVVLSGSQRRHDLGTPAHKSLRVLFADDELSLQEFMRTELPRFLNVSRRKRGKSADADNAPCGSPFFKALFQVSKLTSKSLNT